ncbi:hypothetical protein OF83DRAFT_651660 [Amylostereum chailletii]|nr:hypothetical protein OF83DRAFT_651660 [Amylostereum chailletii]
MGSSVFLFALVAALYAGVASAALYPTQPVSDTVFTAGRLNTVTWIDDGSSPSLSNLSELKLDLYGQGDNLIKNFASNIDPKSQAHKVWISPTLGGNSSDYYFQISCNNPPYVAYTSQFTLTGMTGKSAASTLATSNHTLASTNSSLSSTPARATTSNLVPSLPAATAAPHSTVSASQSPAGKDRDSNGAFGKWDMEGLKFKLVFILWPALMGVSMAL